MVDYRTEEEQIELLKKFWHENGRSVVVGVLLALVLVFGWSQWQSYHRTRIEAASDLFQQMTTAAEALNSDPKVSALAEQLRKDYPNTVYAVFASLRLAKDAVAANELPAAVGFLEWAQSRTTDTALLPLVNMRLAQVQYAQGELDKALASLVKVKSTEIWNGPVAELRGDIQLSQGKQAEARDSYNAAIKAFDTSGDKARLADLEIKLSGLSLSAVASSAVGNNP